MGSSTGAPESISNDRLIVRQAPDSKAFVPMLVAALALALVTTLAMAVVGFMIVRSLRANLTGAVAHAHRLTRVHAARFDLERAVATVRGYLVSPSYDRRTRAEAAISSARGSLEALKTPPVGPRRGPIVAKVEGAAATYLDAIESILGTTASSSASAAVRFEDETAPKRALLDAALAALVAAEDTHAEVQFVESQTAASRAQFLLLGFGGLSLIFSFLSAWYFGSGLVRAYDVKHRAVVIAERALATRDELLAVIAHDLRSPLSAILMSAAWIARQAQTDAGAEKLVKRARMIETTTNRMGHLIKSLLDATTIEAGRLSVTPEPCDADGLVRAAFETFEPLAGHKDIRLTMTTQTSSAVRVRADRDRIHQVFSNLLSNAIKFTPEGGAIALQSELVADGVRFSVVDTGLGIRKEHLPHLFSRYWKAEQGGSPGTGLGLYISKGIVEAHGRTIGVESVVGRGSTFWFTLPTAVDITAPC